jgi:hypothetical protein
MPDGKRMKEFNVIIERAVSLFCAAELSCAEVRVTIEKLLDQGLPRVYTPELFEQKTSAVFQHVYDAYYGAGRSLYAAA